MDLIFREGGQLICESDLYASIYSTNYELHAEGPLLVRKMTFPQASHRLSVIAELLVYRRTVKIPTEYKNIEKRETYVKLD